MTPKILLVLDDNDLNTYPEYSLATKKDWRRVPEFLNGEWPQKFPSAHFLGEDIKADREWYKGLLQSPYVVFDVETEQLPDKRYSGRIIQVGLYGRSGAPAIWDRLVYPDFPFVKLYEHLIQAKTMVAHNTPFDVARIHDNFGVHWSKYKKLEDTIIMHHLLWAEHPHRLEFVSSIYSNLPKVKHLGVGNYDYLIGDIVCTADAFDGMTIEMDQDPRTKELYYNCLMRLEPIIMEFCHRGIPVNHEFVKDFLSRIPHQLEKARQMAALYCGYDISLESGSQLKIILDEIEDVFTVAKKLTGVTIKKKYTEKGELSLDKDTLTSLREAWLPIDFNEESDEVLMLSRIALGGHPLLEAKALWNSCRVNLSNYIKPLLVPLTEIDGEFYYESTLHVGGGSPQVLYQFLED